MLEELRAIHLQVSSVNSCLKLVGSLGVGAIPFKEKDVIPIGAVVAAFVDEVWYVELNILNNRYLGFSQ